MFTIDYLYATILAWHPPAIRRTDKIDDLATNKEDDKKIVYLNKLCQMPGSSVYSYLQIERTLRHSIVSLLDTEKRDRGDLSATELNAISMEDIYNVKFMSDAISFLNHGYMAMKFIALFVIVLLLACGLIFNIHALYWTSGASVFLSTIFLGFIRNGLTKEWPSCISESQKEYRKDLHRCVPRWGIDAEVNELMRSADLPINKVKRTAL